MIKKILKYLILYILHFIIIKSTEVSIKNEEELNDILYNSNDNTLTININNNNDDDIILSKDIIINNDNIKKLCIQGISKESSILRFNEISKEFILNNSFEEFKLINVTLYGSLKFNNIKNVNLENSVLHGTMKFDSSNTNNEMIEMNNFIYYLDTDITNNGIELYGNVTIKHSNFYGNSNCKESILYYNGGNINKIDISDSYFDGKYSNNCLSIYDAISSNISSSIFKNGGSYNGDGG